MGKCLYCGKEITRKDKKCKYCSYGVLHFTIKPIENTESHQNQEKIH